MLKTMFYYIVSPSLMVYTPVTDVFIRIQANADLFSTPSTFKISQTVTAGRKCPILQYVIYYYILQHLFILRQSVKNCPL